MPLDGQAYLRAQGWQGKGSGLRQGSIVKPLSIPQKRTLAGIGKDRDEAYPFWDHLFSAASKTINIKVYDDEHDSDIDCDPVTKHISSLHRTSTGLLSSLPLTQVSHLEQVEPSSPKTPSISLLATAKREAARKRLYSRFFRGPIMVPDLTHGETASSSTASSVGGEGSSKGQIKLESADACDLVRGEKKRKTDHQRRSLSATESPILEAHKLLSSEKQGEKRKKRRKRKECAE